MIAAITPGWKMKKSSRTWRVVAYVSPVVVVAFLSGCIPQPDTSNGIHLKGELPYDGVLVIER